MFYFGGWLLKAQLLGPVTIDQDKDLEDVGVYPKVHLSRKTVTILTLQLSFCQFLFASGFIME